MTVDKTTNSAQASIGDNVVISNLYSAGVITTATTTSIGALATDNFTVLNSRIVTGSVVLLTIVDYAGVLITNGIPVLSVDTIAAGSFNINITNAHASNGLSGVMKIAFIIL